MRLFNVPVFYLPYLVTPSPLRKKRKSGFLTPTLNFNFIDAQTSQNASFPYYFNIDIEGYELQVLKTVDFDYFDIKVICVEIITSSKNIKKKEKKIIRFLKKKKYTFKFKAGINHVFVRNKRYKGSLI